MTIEVNGCHDCPFMKISGKLYWCDIVSRAVYDHAINCIINPSCPLKQETITIKLKEDEQAKSNKEL